MIDALSAQIERLERHLGDCVEAAHFARRYCEPARRFHERKRARTNAAVAIKALAHKISRACHHMLHEQTRCDEKRCLG